MNPTGRFTNRVDFYAKHRPGYPDAAWDVLAEALPAGCTVADVGSGTGISSRWLLQRASRVYGVEPNAAMRAAAVSVEGFVSVDGSAEATGLEDSSVDAVVCATAFHWFRIEEARREFSRILRDDGCVVLLWNVRKREASDLQRGYERLIAEFATDYQRAWDHESGTIVDSFFAGEAYQRRAVPYAQIFDWEGFLGRALSASYMPLDDQALVARLRALFDGCQQNGTIRFEYDTAIYWGRCKYQQ